MSSSAADKLTPRQRLFCQEYVVDSNAPRAYEAAGYQSKREGYVADACASRLLKLAKIQAYISELLEHKKKASGVTGERIISELAAIAFHRSKKTTTIKDGIATVIDSDDWDEDSSAAVQEISGEATQIMGDDSSLVAKRLKVKTYDKVRALELLSKINGLTSDLPMAIATLKNYGIVLKRDPETNRFYVE